MRLNLAPAQKSIDDYFRKKRVKSIYMEFVKQHGDVLKRFADDKKVPRGG